MDRRVIAILAFLFATTTANSQEILQSSRAKNDKVIVCYVASWAAYRPGRGKFELENLKPELCTHLIYSFAGLNVKTSKIRSLDPWGDLEEGHGKGTYKKITAIRERYPGLKVTLAVGGWNEGSANFSAIAASPTRRGIFIDSVLEFMNNYGFNGLDLCWEFPGKRGGAPYDKENFSHLVRELSTALKTNGLLLTAAISADKNTINDAYDIPEISKYLDFIHVMAYDYHGAWDKWVLPNAPLKCSDKLCVEESINHLMELGAPVEKIVLGLPMYGKTFVITNLPIHNSAESPMGASAFDKGFMGSFTKEIGILGYNEICRELLASPNKWRTGWDSASNSAYAINQDKVIVYDNGQSLINKAEYVKRKNLAGVMIWSIDTDDFRGDCSQLHTDYSNPFFPSNYPLMRTINWALA